MRGCWTGVASVTGQVWASTAWVLNSSSRPVRELLVSRASSSSARGRRCGSLARAASTMGRSRSGTAEVSGSMCRIRYKMASEDPVPNGISPLAA